MRRLTVVVGILFSFLLYSTPAFAVSAGADITNYASSTLSIIVSISAAAAVFFLIKGGYLYFTSSGSPEALEQAKKTIRNALVGLVLVLAAGAIVSIFSNALGQPATNGSTSALNLSQITTVKPSDGLTQVLIDAVSGFMQNIVQSATKPLVDGIMGYLATTPSVLTNSVIVHFWLVMVGITDSLFVLIVALLGLHFMSASTFGFEEVELRQLLPKIGLAFLGTNISLFLADYAITTSNALVNEVLHATGGLNHAWITNAITLPNMANGTAPLITLLFLILFLIVAIVLLLLYISRLIMISLGAVLSPFIFLLWIIPKCSDIAEIAVKTYLVTVFMVFVHVVIIQLAASFLSLPDNGGGNSLLSIAVAIGLFFTLLKTPSTMMQLVSYTSRTGTMRKIGGQIMNVMTTGGTASGATEVPTKAKTKRRVVAA